MPSYTYHMVNAIISRCLESLTNIKVYTYATVVTGRAKALVFSGKDLSWFMLMPISNNARASHCNLTSNHYKVLALLYMLPLWLIMQPAHHTFIQYTSQELVNFHLSLIYIYIYTTLASQSRQLTWIVENRLFIMIFRSTAMTKTCNLVNMKITIIESEIVDKIK